MDKSRYVYWKNGKFWLGYLEEYPDYMTQGKALKELQENLKDIYKDLTSGKIPGARRVGELQVA
jgi:hypothetical protein